MKKALLVLSLVAGQALAQSSPDNEDRRVWIENQSSRSITHFYATRESLDDWGQDRLEASETIRSGGRKRMNITDGTRSCVFDFKAKLSGGREVTKMRINVCEESEWVVY